MVKINEVHALILAGGESRRFNGEDKGLIEWRNKPLIEYVVERLAGQVAGFTVSCNRNNTTYDSLAARLSDKFDFHPSPIPRCLNDRLLPNFRGPIAGIYEFLQLYSTTRQKLEAAAGSPQFSPARYLMICCCDCPTLPRDIVSQLHTGIDKTNAGGAYARDQLGSHYLTSLVNCSIAVNSMEKVHQLSSAARSISARQWLNQINAVGVDLVQGNIHNINSPADLTRLDQCYEEA